MDTPESSKYNELNNAQVTNVRMGSWYPAPITPESLIQSSFHENINAYIPMEEVQKILKNKQLTKKVRHIGLFIYLYFNRL